jgi:hypothetical protein
MVTLERFDEVIGGWIADEASSPELIGKDPW